MRAQISPEGGRVKRGPPLLSTSLKKKSRVGTEKSEARKNKSTEG